jgi:hypothetical protein
VTEEETELVLRAVRMYWAHSSMGGSPEEVFEFWHGHLRDVDSVEALAALGEMASTREHAPNPAQVVAAIAERSGALPGWDEVQDEILRAIRFYRPPMEWYCIRCGADVVLVDDAWGHAMAPEEEHVPERRAKRSDPYAAPPEEYWSHPAIARFMEHSWDEWRMAPEPAAPGMKGQWGTFNAQQRDAWVALASREQRRAAGELLGVQQKRIESVGVLKRLDP